MRRVSRIAAATALAAPLVGGGCTGPDDESSGAGTDPGAVSDDEVLATEDAGSTDGGDASLNTTTTDADAESDSDTASASTGAPACAPRPPAATPWLVEFQTEVVAALTGERQALPGTTLGVRSSDAARAATADYIAGQLSSLGLDVAEHAYAADGRNIYATIEATQSTAGSDAWIVVGAHFDTVPGSPGANDNATGVALILSLARYLTEIECRNVGVIVVALDQEEIGLVGSDNFAAFLEQQAFDIVAVHTVDQMGWDDDGDRGIELERADDGLLEAYEAAEAALPMTIPITPTQTGSTDHVAFRNYGFAAVGITEQFVSGDTTRHYHAPTDTMETVDFAFLASSTALVHEVIGQRVWP